jgi:hypothetical protein
MIMWTQLAVALVFELGIHREPPGDEGQFCSKSTWFPLRLPEPQMRTVEERRAVLGTFIVTSMRVFLSFYAKHTRLHSG